MKLKQEIPNSLRVWFLIHFATDMVFAFPLLFLPVFFMTLLGFPITNLLFVRLVGAALVGIGGASLVMHKAGFETFKAMLHLKILWSISAIAGFIITLLEGGPKIIWLFLGIFVLFSAVWIYYARRLCSLEKKCKSQTGESKKHKKNK